MFIRLSFLLLVALNLGAAGWLVFGPVPDAAPPPVTDPGVPALRLLPDSPPSSDAAAARPASAHSTAQQLGDVCHTLGPFTTTAGMRAAIAALSPHVARIQYRQQAVRRSHGYWVYLPAVATRSAAIADARRLAAKGIHDYYVGTAGDQQNTISLGLFDELSNARHRRAQVNKLGFRAKITQRTTDPEPQYWVDYAVPPKSIFGWKVWLPGRTDLHAQSIDCS
jgi:hypothetical protein